MRPRVGTSARRNCVARCAALAYFDRALAGSLSSPLAPMLSSAILSFIGRIENAARHAETTIQLSVIDQNLYVCYHP